MSYLGKDLFVTLDCLFFNCFCSFALPNHRRFCNRQSFEARTAPASKKSSYPPCEIMTFECAPFECCFIWTFQSVSVLAQKTYVRILSFLWFYIFIFLYFYIFYFYIFYLFFIFLFLLNVFIFEYFHIFMFLYFYSFVFLVYFYIFFIFFSIFFISL